MIPSIALLLSALQASWCSDTSFKAEEWSKENPARGQCVASSLVVQSYLGGYLLRYRVSDDNGLRETHYCNVLKDGTILDTTGSQYINPVTLVITPVDLKGFASVREKRLADKETKKAYNLLKRRVDRYLSAIQAEKPSST